MRWAEALLLFLLVVVLLLVGLLNVWRVPESSRLHRPNVNSDVSRRFGWLLVCLAAMLAAVVLVLLLA